VHNVKVTERGWKRDMAYKISCFVEKKLEIFIAKHPVRDIPSIFLKLKYD